MPTFNTPEPISATFDLVAADVRIIASDRQDTVVEVRPSTSAHEPDVKAAEQTKVEYTSAGLLIKGPKQRNVGLRRIGSVDVTVELPAGSRIEADAGIGALRSTGQLSRCRVKIGAGDVELEQVGPLDLRTGAGAITVEHVAGHADITTGSGRLRVSQIDGSAVIKNSNGETWVGDITGDLRVNAGNGAISVGHAAADLTAGSGNGEIRVDDLSRGSASLKTGFGEINFGIHAGTAAKLDAYTRFGTVRNSMEAADSPEPSDELLEVYARTSFGDIVIRRS
jgi:Putative adhesin